MKILFTFTLMAIILSACSDNQQSSQAILKADTLIGRKVITEEIAGSDYRKRAMGYFVVAGNDSSAFSCLFTESKEGEKVGMEIHSENKTMTYRQRMNGLKKILPEAAKDFNLDSLKSIFIGRLVSNGDLAVDLTKQYQEKFGTDTKMKDFKTVSLFLEGSKLATDFNDLFKPYSLSVDKVFTEKLFFTTKEELYRSGKTESDTTGVPDRILDGMVWIRLKKN